MDGAFPSQRGQPFEGAPDSDGGAAARRGFRGTAENAKTKLCQRWANGDCRFGDRCNFAHGEHELRTLPPRGEPGYGRGGGPGGYGPPRGGYGGPGAYGGGRGMGMGRGQMQGGPGGYAGPRDNGRPGGYGGPPGGGEDMYARQGFPVQGPNGWVAYKTQDTGETYYHNHNSQVTQWDRPVDWPSAPA
ncbi:MAG: hypothetical protein J3K34DRAFT_451520 [Monoraphidium minutum]|nr:MAG: hypothetical protein J3K34DRAFT_451520 [Monoraphidium minutum]